ncbi:succinyl-diaminopimelate desuccinylase [Egibacter rhizosphaerae]|uniref:Succinyl-diaminopimelate desuccinylase n=1 Tax=Egibacter rhizosphaerae TaxID=1670831 RepID=A0A411YKB2_9ACTN|nr:succinyl-diaminopimelate desuccinylase [Egibacter rhizosphaerae]QBI21627.1 succinyl-diaminopimelate desuccinylase [Egibacter rhizosphaerae]
MTGTSRDEGGPPDPLAELALELLGIPSPTGDEGELADWLVARYRDEAVERHGNSLVVGAADPTRPQVLLVGHLDVVPPTDADSAPRREGDRLVGRGASDMKGGLAVAMAAFEDPALRQGPYALRLVAYAGEEGPHDGNELGPLLEAVPELEQAGLAVVLEPTDGQVQLGCLGVLNAHVTVSGQAAHAARPWHGENALTKAGPLLSDLGAREPRDVTVDGLAFREVVTVSQGWTENARNVVPDRFTLNLNVRFAPDKDLVEAETAVRELIGDRGEVVIVDRAPAAAPRADAPLLERFVPAIDAPVSPKQAWTDVARFAAHGVPALNYGPGITAQAHQAGEYVEVPALHEALAALRRFLAT